MAHRVGRAVMEYGCGWMWMRYGYRGRCESSNTHSSSWCVCVGELVVSMVWSGLGRVV
jgi:hypothetical protein